jgi:peptidoglycan/xylan/chitin deacetylase (PgdA/CDA1 family)
VIFGTPILMYHRVGERDGSFMDDYTVSPGTFAAQMAAIKRHGWTPVELERVVAGRRGGIPRRSVAITFDDGFASNRQYAWPILEMHGFPSATFLVTGELGSRNNWDGPGRANYPLLSAEDLTAASPALMRFHAHSATHSDLTALNGGSESLDRELEGPLRVMAELPAAGRMFAYPWGSWNWQVMQRVRNSGYLGACTCMEGLNSAVTNPFLLRRTEITEDDVGWRFRLKLFSGRDIVQWPVRRPPEISVLGAWLRQGRKSHRGGSPK